jgi:hypothetical protein
MARREAIVRIDVELGAAIAVGQGDRMKAATLTIRGDGVGGRDEIRRVGFEREDPCAREFQQIFEGRFASMGADVENDFRVGANDFQLIAKKAGAHCIRLTGSARFRPIHGRWTRRQRRFASAYHKRSRAGEQEGT